MPQNATVQIRPLASLDYEVWLPLWLGYQDFYEVDIPNETTELTWQRLLDVNEPVNGALAWAGEQAVGLVHWIYHRTCWTPGDDCYLQDLFVAPGKRGGGVGRRLIERVYQEAGQAGCSSVYWLTHETNITAQQLYNRIAERTGFIHYCRAL